MSSSFNPLISASVSSSFSLSGTILASDLVVPEAISSRICRISSSVKAGMAPPKKESPTSVRSFNSFASKAHSGTPLYSPAPLFCDPFPSLTSYRSFFPSFQAGAFCCPDFVLFAYMVNSHNTSPGFTDLNGTVSLSTSAGNSHAFASSKSLKTFTNSIAP